MTNWMSRTPEARALLAEERLVLAATEMIYEAMERIGVSKKELADRLDVRPSEISQRLSGRRNLTLRSLARMLHVLGYEVGLTIRRASTGSSGRGDAFGRTVGSRVTKKMAGPVEQDRARLFRAVLYAHLTGTLTRDDELLDRHIREVWDELDKLDHIDSVSIQREDGCLVAIYLGVTADDPLEASSVATAAVRTAIHIVGGQTPQWDNRRERFLSRLETEVAEDSDRSSEKPCTV